MASYPSGEQSTGQEETEEVEQRRKKWHARLHAYRRLVLFLWDALLFRGPVLHGAAVWLAVNILMLALATVEGSVVYHTGNVLLMAALAYALLFTALKYGQIQLYPDWNADHEQQFSVVCRHLAYLEKQSTTIFTSVTEARKTKPKMFYLVGLLVVLLASHLGDWVPTALVLQLLVCLVLLLPPALERGWFTDVTFDSLGSALHSSSSAVWQISKTLLADVYQRLQEARKRREKEAGRREGQEAGRREGQEAGRREGQEAGRREGQEAGRRVVKSQRDHRQ